MRHDESDTASVVALVAVCCGLAYLAVKQPALLNALASGAKTAQEEQKPEDGVVKNTWFGRFTARLRIGHLRLLQWVGNRTGGC